eukprot:SAG11_NODE_17508_length_516_cov_0.983213_2_plen_56_part_01
MFFFYASYKSFTRNSWWSKKNEDIFSIPVSGYDLDVLVPPDLIFLRHDDLSLGSY